MPETLVLGAGMVGIATALELQARGHAVTVIDRRAPGRETSFGNAGIIQAEAAEPYAMPRDLPTLLRQILGRSNDLTWSLPGLIRMAPALAAYFRQSAPARHAKTSAVYARLIARATEDHAGLIAAAGADNLISKQGYALIFRDPVALERAAADLDRLHRTYGLEARVLDARAAATEEPGLIAPVAGAILWPQAWNCSDPGGLVGLYADLFRQRGGRIVVGEASTLRQTGAGWAVGGPDGGFNADAAVVALGPWSPQLLRRFGYRVRMVFKRGYHGHYDTDRPLRRPLVDPEHGIVAAPMRQGLRIATGAALVAQDAPPDLRQLQRGAAAISDLVAIGARRDEPQWHGTRPCLPDMLPMAGPAPRHQGLWFHFGHGHQGFTLGPTTARCLADWMAGGQSDLLAAALDPKGRCG